jgi:hypothetical protein
MQKTPHQSENWEPKRTIRRLEIATGNTDLGHYQIARMLYALRCKVEASHFTVTGGLLTVNFSRKER